MYLCGDVTKFKVQNPSWEARIPQLINKFPASYWNQNFTTVPTEASHLCVSDARLIQAIPFDLSSLRSILIIFFSVSLDLSNGLFLSVLPINVAGNETTFFNKIHVVLSPRLTVGLIQFPPSNSELNYHRLLLPVTACFQIFVICVLSSWDHLPQLYK